MEYSLRCYNMLPNEYLVEIILQNDRITCICTWAIKVLIKLVYYSRISSQKVGEPVVAELLPLSIGK